MKYLFVGGASVYQLPIESGEHALTTYVACAAPDATSARADILADLRRKWPESAGWEITLEIGAVDPALLAQVCGAAS